MSHHSMPKTVYHELSASDHRRDITHHYWGALLPNSDQIVQQYGTGDVALYEQVLRDDQVFACLQQRILGQISAEWHLENGGDREVDRACTKFIDQQIRNINFDDICRKMLLGLFYGYSIAECLWQKQNDQIVLSGIKVRNVQRFGFDGQHRLVLKTKDNPQGETLPEGKFWLFRSGAENDDMPYGRGLAYWLYWPVWFKRNFIRFWSQHAERFAAPTLAGKYPSHITDQEKQQFLETLDNMRSRSTLAIPDNMAVDILESTRQVGGDYHRFIERMDQAISKIILSQTLTTDHGASLSQAQVHQAMRSELIKADADLLCQSLNQSVITWLAAWNFPRARVPKLWRDCSVQADEKSKIEIDKGLFSMGYRLNPELVRSRYGEGYEQVEEVDSRKT